MYASTAKPVNGTRNIAWKSRSDDACPRPVVEALRWWRHHVQSLKPRSAPCGEVREVGDPLPILTDDAVEPHWENRQATVATFGAVMFDPIDGCIQTLGGTVPAKLRQKLGHPTQQAIGQAELLPCLLARHVWKKRFRRRLVLWFVDNEPAKYPFGQGQIFSSAACKPTPTILCFFGQK